MEVLNQQTIKQIVEEIDGSSELSRRAEMKRRHDMYKDDSKKFLVEQLTREFDPDAIKEMRLAPINVLKKIINKRSTIYRDPPKRTVELPSDQALLDYYTKELNVNGIMGKANKYYNLFSNTVVYCYPYGEGKLKLAVVPPYLYSIVPNQFDPTKIECFVFNDFTESGQVTPSEGQGSATGVESWSRSTGIKHQGDLVASKEERQDQNRRYIFWTASEHFTTDKDGNKIFLIQDNQDPEQFFNPIGVSPVINLAKERDAEPWANQGSDLPDNCLNFQIGWTDLLTIAKHQGYSIMTIISPDEPKKLTIGVNRAVWLKQSQDGPTPSISYVQAASPLDEYKSVLMEYLSLILTSNDMNPNAVSGKDGQQNYTSGFSRLIQMADALEAIEMDKPAMADAEHELWEVISKWHNYMWDLNVLDPEAKALGRFSEDMEVSIVFAATKPMESDQERIATVKELIGLGLISQKDAVKRLNPDMTEEQIDQKILEIEDQSKKRMKEANEQFGEPEELDAEDGGQG